jgi:hypothetical protein
MDKITDQEKLDEMSPITEKCTRFLTEKCTKKSWRLDMRNLLFVLFQYLDILNLDGAVNATGKFKISLADKIAFLRNRKVVFPVNCSLTIIKGEQKNKDDYYGK